ncbi:MAG TPA: hypothetical protein VF006_17450 [Longimicrobium sp.]
MKKLRLNLDQLAVDSFDTAVPEEKKGTVFGEQCTCQTICTCPGCPTCDNTCPNTCAYSCDDMSCGGSCWYTECPGTGQYDHTCNATVQPFQECCPM